MKKLMAAAIAFGVVLAGSAWSHHGMSALFDFDQRFTRTGTLTKVDWRNPHIYLLVEAKTDEDGMEEWAFEGPSPNFFRSREGVGKTEFQGAIGETVIVEASRARDGSRTGLIRMITLPDGTVVSLCPQNC